MKKYLFIFECFNYERKYGFFLYGFNLIRIIDIYILKICIFTQTSHHMRIGLISDIHEDIHNLEKALLALEGLADEIYCLGDITGFTDEFYSFKPDANECIRLVRENCSGVVIGNHDLYSVQKIPRHCSGFQFPENWYSLSEAKKREIAGKKIWLYTNEDPPELSDFNKAWLNQLPEYKKCEIAGSKILLSHFFYPDLTGSETLKKFTYTSVSSHQAYMSALGADMAFCGHVHSEGLLKASRKQLGVRRILGMPVAFSAFEKKSKIEKNEFIAIPAVASGHRRSGFALFDTEDNTVTAHEINGQ